MDINNDYYLVSFDNMEIKIKRINGQWKYKIKCGSIYDFSWNNLIAEEKEIEDLIQKGKRIIKI